MTQSWLSWFLRGLIILSALSLLGRLVELQIIKGNYFRVLAEENRVRRIPIAAPRGEILARGGEVLIENIKTNNSSETIISEWKRKYGLGAGSAHLSGYLGEVNEGEVGKVDPLCSERGPRKLGSLLGRGGLEEEYDCELRGIDGEELIEVDTMDKRVRTLGRREPVSGEDIRTNIDYELQKRVSKVMRQKGAVVATDGWGQVLAIYSAPSYDPQNIQKFLSDTGLPLFNRAIGGIYHPGSVFKIVTAVAALEEAKIDKDFKYDDPGVITIKEFSYSNWFFSQYGQKEGIIDLKRAIARSTDTFFYNLGGMIGPDRLAEWAQVFGLKNETGIDLPGELGGLIPTPEWKEKYKGERWFLGNTYHMAIGQGDIAFSPLAANVMTSVIASDGYLCVPSIAKKPECKKLNIKEETIEEVKVGMIGACQKGGTGIPFFDFPIIVACKTGTAETGIKSLSGKQGKSHAWFTVFAPADNPEIVLTVLVEEGGEGSRVAAPIAREILDFWFNER